MAFKSLMDCMDSVIPTFLRMFGWWFGSAQPSMLEQWLYMQKDPHVLRKNPKLRASNFRFLSVITLPLLKFLEVWFLNLFEVRANGDEIVKAQKLVSLVVISAGRRGGYGCRPNWSRLRIMRKSPPNSLLAEAILDLRTTLRRHKTLRDVEAY